MNMHDRFRSTNKRFLTVLKLACIPLGAVLAIGLYCGVNLLMGNFHTTIPGELYRSAQPTASRLAAYQKEYGIKTIVNLRGENAGRGWYDTETAAARQLGIHHIDFRMSARRELSQSEATALVSILKDAEKPILIHCQGGADRSGLVAALYVAAIAHGSESDAEAQISLRYNHFSVSPNPAYAMDRTFEILEPWLGFPDS